MRTADCISATKGDLGNMQLLVAYIDKKCY